MRRCAGAARAGAEEIVVVDCHGAGGDWTFNSLIPERLDPRLHLGSRIIPGRVIQNCWSRARTLACWWACTRATIPPMASCVHTISTVKWHNLRFNDDLVGESGINAALCGHYGCPVLLTTGDEAVCREVKALLGDGLTTVAVKRGLSRFSARQIPPVRAREMIEAGAYQALQDLSAVAPYVPAAPVTIAIEIDQVEKMAEFQGRSGVELDYEAQTVYSRAADWMSAWESNLALGSLMLPARRPIGNANLAYSAGPNPKPSAGRTDRVIWRSGLALGAAEGWRCWY